MNGQAPADQATQVLPDVWKNDQRRPDLQVLPTLAECEQVIERGKPTFIDMGLALGVIRDNRLYHEQGYRNFDTYCRERWGWTRQRSDQLIAASKVTTVVVNERQARALRVVTEEDPPIAEASAWSDLVRLMEQIEALTSSDASLVATTVPSRRRATTAKRLRKLGTYLGRIAWTLEGNEA